VILGVIGSEPGRAIRELERAETLLGRCGGSAAFGTGVVAFWPNPSGVPTSVKQACALEGWIDGDEPPSLDAATWATCSSSLQGDFALIAGVGDHLIAVAGRGMGYRPLFVGRLGDDVSVVCSRLEPLIRLAPSLKRDLDIDYLASRVCVRQPLDDSCTPFARVRQVPPLEAWVISANGEPRRVSTFVPLSAPEAVASEGHLAAELRDELRSAVSRCMARTTSTGVMVSGGVDSSSVLALCEEIARRTGNEIVPIYWRFETNDPGRDGPYLDALARHRGLKPRPLDPAAAFPLVHECLVSDAMPCWSVSSALWVATGRLAAALGVRLVLTGLGGDTVMEGDQRALACLARSGAPFRALTMAARLRGSQPAGSALTLALRSIQASIVRPLVTPLVPAQMRRHIRRRRLSKTFAWAGPRMRRHISQLADRPVPEASMLSPSPAQRCEALSRMPFIWEVETIRSQEEDQTCCVRADPFFDDRFLRFVATLPPLSLMQGGFRRGLLRESMRDLLPDMLRWRTSKASMASAIRQTIEGAGGATAFRNLADARMLGDLGLVEPRHVLSQFERSSRTREGPPWAFLWGIFSVEAFLRRIVS
jgi:asparagine synthase (glutamine-hydrolysing)